MARPKKLNADWVKPSQLFESFQLTKDTVKRMRDEGILKKGVHYLDINPHATPRYRYHLKRIEQTLASLTK